MVVGCGDPSGVDAGPRDAAASDGSVDASSVDAGSLDASSLDAGALDASSLDAGALDAAVSLDGGSTGSGFADVVTRALYDTFFLHRSDAACSGGLFTYEALVAAAARFPRFAADGSLEVRRREAAAFLANVSHETTGGWATAPDGPHAWGLCFREEVGCEAGGCTGYCDTSRYTCTPGRTYHGRGPMQLSWNYNYAQAGDALGLDLLNDPDLVTRDGMVAWLTALWFWMTPQAPKPSSHDVMTGGWTPSAADVTAGRMPGFGMTINIINGGLECNRPTDGRVDDRVGFFTRYCGLLGVDVGANLYCDTMLSY